MREILFRGKRVDNGEWVYGVPIQCYDGDWQICTDCSKLTVIPETIGQYTGLNDKNGKKIFEGDIVKRQFNDFPTHIYTVEFNYGEFELVSVTTKGKMFISFHLECEIIGNIHDNHELI